MPIFADSSVPVPGTPRAADRTQASRDVVIDSAQLFADRKLIHIDHHGERYALRETRLGKLILTK